MHDQFEDIDHGRKRPNRLLASKTRDARISTDSERDIWNGEQTRSQARAWSENAWDNETAAVALFGEMAVLRRGSEWWGWPCDGELVLNTYVWNTAQSSFRSVQTFEEASCLVLVL